MTLSKILIIGAVFGCVTFAQAEPPRFQPKEYQAPVYEEIGGYVRPNLEGVVRASNFLQWMEAKYPKLTKGEYETTQEFDARVEDQDLWFRASNWNMKYMFKTGINVKYDADNEVYSTFGNDFGYGFTECYAESNTIFCMVGLKSYAKEIYTGQNKFGAKVDIEKTRTEYVALSLTNFKFDRASFYFSSGTGDSKFDGMGRVGVTFNPRFYVPIDRARTFKSENLSVLFVGTIESPNISTYVYYRAPKIDSPHDDFKKYHGVQFKLAQILLCVDRTGEIVDRKVVQ